MQVRCLSSPSPLCWFAHDRFLGPHTTMYSTSIDPCFMSSSLNHCDNRSEKRPEEASRQEITEAGQLSIAALRKHTDFSSTMYHLPSAKKDVLAFFFLTSVGLLRMHKVSRIIKQCASVQQQRRRRKSHHMSTRR